MVAIGRHQSRRECRAGEFRDRRALRRNRAIRSPIRPWFGLVDLRDLQPPCGDRIDRLGSWRLSADSSTPNGATTLRKGPQRKRRKSAGPVLRTIPRGGREFVGASGGGLCCQGFAIVGENNRRVTH